jgi:hypothetical protein
MVRGDAVTDEPAVGWLRGHLLLILFVPLVLSVAFGFAVMLHLDRQAATDRREICESSNEARQAFVATIRGIASDFLPPDELARVEVRLAQVPLSDCGTVAHP